VEAARGHAGLKPVFFASPDDFRDWLEEHHQSETELLVGFYKKGSGKPSMTWSQSVDQALCFGWIDGVRRGLDDESYTIRFTPRKKRSTWSKVNVAKVEALERDGRMRPAGRAAYEARSEDNTGIYSFERARPAELPPEYRERFTPEASEFFESQPPGYRRTAIHWVMSAKKEETRERRLATLIEDSVAGRRLANLTRPAPVRKSEK
jgi:uncharacterized protein YdeI (YjbR/CyaY-like superfamily)